ncbi:MAG: hypothetical protein COA45_08575 [Zetaproteobacteria bacterium]|nr:MAG: hypothetical protein COA45_08575 [Zetaproteobacteria bacterium]
MRLSPVRFIKLSLIGIALLCPGASYAQSPPPDYTTGLVGHWELDETSGSSIADSSGSNTGTWVDGVNNDVAEETITGQINTGLTFDGSDDGIDAGNDASLQITGDMAISAWINANSVSGRQRIVGWQSAGEAEVENNLYALTIDGNDIFITHEYGAGSNVGLTYNTTLTTGTWYHIVMSRDVATDQISVYLNGTLVSTQGYANDPTGGSTGRMYIGYFPSMAWDFDGTIDDVRVYNRTLSATDITALYNYTGTNYTCTSPNGVTGEMIFNADVSALQYCNSSSWVGIGPADTLKNGLVGHWELDETSGTTVTDNSSSGNNGSMGGGMDAASDTTSGKISTSLNFDGDDNIVIGAAANNFDDIFIGGGTISYWVYPTNWGTFGRVIDKSDTGTFPPNAGWHSQGTPSIIKFSHAFSTTYGDWETGASTLPLNQWSHVTIAYNSDSTTNTPAIYINASSLAVSTPSTPVGTAVSDAAHPVTIGSRQGGGNYITGNIDDVRMYDRTLSATEVSKLYGLGSSCTATTSNLIGHWKLDETSGAVIADSSVNSNTGTWTDGVNNDVTEETIAGQDGTAIAFDGVDDSINVGNDANLNITDNTMTISGWIKKSTANQTNRMFRRGIDGTDGYQFSIGQSGCTSTQITFSKYYVSHFCFDGVPADTNWHHYAVVVDTTGMSAYVDGVQTDSNSNTANIRTSVEVGIMNSIGSLDDFRIYSDALTSLEIAELYGSTGGICTSRNCTSPAGLQGEILFNTDYDVMQYCNGSNWIAMGPAGNGGGGCTNPTGLAAELRYNTDFDTVQYCEGDEWISVIGQGVNIPQNGLVAHWTMNETTGSTIADSSSASNNGIWSDGVNDDTTEETISGVNAAALSFDETNDVITVSHDATLDINTAYTMSSWVYFDSTVAGTIRPSLISKNNTGGWGSGWIIGRTSGGGNIINGKIRLAVQHNRDGSAPSSDYTGWLFPIDTWNYVTVTWDGSAVNYYLNATLIYTGAISVAPDTGSGDLLIGFARSNWSSTFDSGNMDDMRLYNRALTQPEIQIIYEASNDACLATPLNVNTLCKNGSYHVGNSPDGGAPMYMTNITYENASGPWDDATYDDAPADSLTDGDGNTAALVADPTTHAAAEYCDSLTAHGYSDWYLPAEDELNLIWNSGAPTIGDIANGVSGSYYWSSTEISNANARTQRMYNGTQASFDKNVDTKTRCVRK